MLYFASLQILIIFILLTFYFYRQLEKIKLKIDNHKNIDVSSVLEKIDMIELRLAKQEKDLHEMQSSVALIKLTGLRK